MDEKSAVTSKQELNVVLTLSMSIQTHKTTNRQPTWQNLRYLPIVSHTSSLHC